MSNKVSASKQKRQFLNEYLPGRDIEYNEIVNFHIDIDIQRQNHFITFGWYYVL